MDNFDSPEAEKVAMCRRICKDLSNILYNKAMELSLLCFLPPHHETTENNSTLGSCGLVEGGKGFN